MGSITRKLNIPTITAQPRHTVLGRISPTILRGIKKSSVANNRRKRRATIRQPLSQANFRYDIFILLWPQRRRSPSAHLVRRKVERLVGSHYSSAVPGLVPNIVPAPSVTFVSQWWRVHCACGRHIYSGANVRGQGTRHLVEGTLDPLVGILFFQTEIAHDAIQCHPPL